MTVSEFWNEQGLDSDELTKRFVGNLQLAALCTKKFASDSHYDALIESIKAKDYGGIELNAHSLMGVGANLGFETFRSFAQVLIDDVRTERYENIESDFEGVKEEYKRLCTEIKKID